MSLILIERPAETSFSRNPVRYSLVTNTALDMAGLRIDVRLLYKALTASGYTRTFEISLAPDSNGVASIDLNKILDSLVTNSLPSIASTSVQRAFEQVGMFYIEYREISNATPTAGWTSDSTSARYVVKGGLPYERWQGPNYFLTYPNPFLTWQKTGRNIGATESSWLTYLHTGASATSVSAKVSIYYTDGTSDLDAITMAFPDATVVKNSMYRIPVGPEHAGITAFDTAKVVEHYAVKVVDGSSTLHEDYLFTVDYRNTYSTTTFNFINSIGGMDSIRVRGTIQREARYENQMAETTPDAGYFNENQLVPTTFTQQVMEQITFKGSIGLMDDDDEMDRLRDLRISKGVYQAKFGRWWPVNLVNGTTNMGSADDELKDYPLEWTYGFINESYAPESVTFDDLPTCPIVTGITYTGTTLSWTGDASHISYEIDVTNASGTFVLKYKIYTNSTSVTGPLVSDGGGLFTMTFKIRARCGYNTSAWA